MSTPNVPTASLPLEKQLENLRADLAAERARTDRATTITIVLGAIVLLLVGGFFLKGYREIAWVMQPEQAVALAGQQLNDNLPELRRTMAKRLTEMAPSLIKDLSNKALETVPGGRKQL